MDTTTGEKAKDNGLFLLDVRNESEWDGDGRIDFVPGAGTGALVPEAMVTDPAFYERLEEILPEDKNAPILTY